MVVALAAGFDVVASTTGAPVAAFEDRARKLAGVQYHPEVLHSPHGQQVLSRFLIWLIIIPAAIFGWRMWGIVELRNAIREDAARNKA